MLKKTVIVYRVEGLTGKSKAVLKKTMIAEVNIDEEIADTMLSKYVVSEEQKIRGEVWACNLAREFLFTTKNYPILYTDIWAEDETGLIRKKICRLTAVFKVTSDPKSENELFKKVLKGKFIYEVSLNNNIQELDSFEVYPGNKEMLSMFMNFTQMPDMKQFLENLAKNELEKILESYHDNTNKAIKPNITYSVKDEVEKELEKNI
jgi:hypothetical protein